MYQFSVKPITHAVHAQRDDTCFFCNTSPVRHSRPQLGHEASLLINIAWRGLVDRPRP